MNELMIKQLRTYTEHFEQEMIENADASVAALPATQAPVRMALVIGSVAIVLMLIGFTLMVSPGESPVATNSPPSTVGAPVTAATATPSTEAPPTTALEEFVAPPPDDLGSWREIGSYRTVDGQMEPGFNRVEGAELLVIEGTEYLVTWSSEGLWYSTDGIIWQQGPNPDLSGDTKLVTSRSGLFFVTDEEVAHLNNDWVKGDWVAVYWDIPDLNLVPPPPFTHHTSIGPTAVADERPLLVMRVEADIDLGRFLGHPDARLEEIYDSEEELPTRFELVAEDGTVQGRYRWDVDESGFVFVDDETGDLVAHLPIAEGGTWDPSSFGDGLEKNFASGQERTVVVDLIDGRVVFESLGGFHYLEETPNGVTLGVGPDWAVEAWATADGTTWAPTETLTSSDSDDVIRLASGWLRLVVEQGFYIVAFEYSADGESWTRLDPPANRVDRTWGWGYVIGDRLIVRQLAVGVNEETIVRFWALDIDFTR